jgi:hypothetical protein
MDKKEDGKTIAVYDLGGGTFDVSILEMNGTQFVLGIFLVRVQDSVLIYAHHSWRVRSEVDERRHSFGRRGFRSAHPRSSDSGIQEIVRNRCLQGIFATNLVFLWSLDTTSNRLLMI